MKEYSNAALPVFLKGIGRGLEIRKIIEIGSAGGSVVQKKRTPPNKKTFPLRLFLRTRRQGKGWGGNRENRRYRGEKKEREMKSVRKRTNSKGGKLTKSSCW